MFQVEPILWLQTFASPLLTWLMAMVTLLGYSVVYAALLLMLAFAVRFRPALGVLLGLLFAGVASIGLKTAVAFPRPGDVDPRVLEPGVRSPTPPAAPDAAGFWSLPSAEARAAGRAKPGASYGFPSGHVSTAAAFCLGVILFFHWRRFLGFALAWPLVMGLSRMYLGRHFIADVVGGLAVGAVAAWLAALLLVWLEHPPSASHRQRRLAVIWALTLGLAALTLLTPLLDAENVGRLAGLIGAYGVFAVLGFPPDGGRLGQRAGRFAGAMLIYLATGRLVNRVLEASGWEEVRLAVLLAAALTLAGTLLGGVALGRRLRWYPVS